MHHLVTLALVLHFKLLVYHLEFCNTRLELLDLDRVALDFLLVAAIELVQVCVVHLTNLHEGLADPWVQAR